MSAPDANLAGDAILGVAARMLGAPAGAYPKADAPQPVRACAACKHFHLNQDADAQCRHPAYRLPVPWLKAIERGQPRGGDNAPLWEARS